LRKDLFAVFYHQRLFPHAQSLYFIDPRGFHHYIADFPVNLPTVSTVKPSHRFGNQE
jgi:hypothetical protein